MFNLLKNALSGAISAVKGAFTAPKAPAPAPRPTVAPRPSAPPPASFAPLASWGQTPTQIRAQTAAWAASPAARQQTAWLNQQRAAQAAAAAAEAARQAEIRRKAELKRRAQANLDATVGRARGAVGAAAQKAGSILQNWLGKSKKATTTDKKSHEGFSTQEEADSFNKWFAQQTPERQAEVTAFNKTSNEYQAKAKQTIEQMKSSNSKGLFGFLAPRNSRTFAQKQVESLATQQVDKYKKTLDAFNKKKASESARLNAKMAAGTITQADVDAFNQWQSDQVSNLQYTAAATEGLVKGYGSKASEQLKDPVSRAGSWFNKNIANGIPGKVAGGLFNYTLGQGDKKAPSLVTAPGRAVNTLLNWSGLAGNRNYHEGKTDNSKVTSLADAWQKSFNQRNFNIGQPKAGTKQDFDSWYKTRDTSQLKSAGWSEDRIKKLFQKTYDANKFDDKAANYTLETLADPVAGLGKAAKLPKWAAGLAKPLTKTATASGWLDKGTQALNSVKNNKAIKWLGAEHKNYATRKADFVAEELDDIAQKKPQVLGAISAWQSNKSSIKAAEKSRILQEVAADVGGLSDAEVKIFQKYFVSGDWSTAGAEMLTQARRTQLGEMATKYKTMLDDLQKRENKLDIPTPYRENYLPHYGNRFSVATRKIKRMLGKDDTDWWFTKPRLHDDLQTRKTLISSLSARRYHSQVARKDLPVLRDIVGGNKDIAANIDRIENVGDYVKRTKWEQAMRVAGAPMRGWKKAVLLGNPAWYANNEIFNQIQGVSAGGLKFLQNQRKTGKYLEHIKTNAGARMKPSEAAKMTREIGSSISNEVGKRGLAQVASKQENRARIALYRTFRQDGMTHAQAVKKVNDNLFDYTTKNFERPLKTVAPFYSWTKGLAKASINMPAQKPKTALAFNELDRNQQQFATEFETIVPELEKLGYTPDEIEKIKTDQAEYYKGRFKIGDKWFTTPFNAFSERGLANMGFNPYATATGETADAVDNYGQTTKGKDANFLARMGSKFPQVNLGKKAAAAWAVQSGRSKPVEGWIGKAGSEGYGLTKEKQGYDPSKPNYVRKMDPRQGLAQDALAFVGVPRFIEFDKGRLVETKRMQKATAEYFAIDSKNKDYATVESERAAIFKKFGITPDDFYKGILAKYDTDATKRIKGQKEDAAAANKKLFEEYASQPQGTRNVWATNKLRELSAAGYFNDNPFLKSFNWINGESVAKADRQMAYNEAKRSGNWTNWTAKYGDSRAGSAKKLAYDKAKKSGDWTAYRKSYGDRRKLSQYQFEGKHFKTAESMQRYKDGAFWKQYMAADKATRRELLAKNPEYNKRANWSDEQWDVENTKKKIEQRTKLRGWGVFADNESKQNLAATIKAGQFTAKKQATKRKKVVWRLS